MGPKFFETFMGRKFYECDVPDLVKALNEIHRDNLHLIALKESELQLRNKELALKERELFLKEKEMAI